MNFKQLIEENFGSIENFNKYVEDKNKIIQLERIESYKENDKLHLGCAISTLDKINEDMSNVVFKDLDEIYNGKCEGWFVDNTECIMLIEDIPYVWKPPYTSIEEIKNNYKTEVNDKGRITSIRDIVENIYDNKNRLVHQSYCNFFTRDKLYIDDNNLNIYTTRPTTRKFTNIKNTKDCTITKNIIYHICTNGTILDSFTNLTFKNSNGKYTYGIMKDDSEEYPYVLILIKDSITIGDEIYLTDAESIILLDVDSE